MKLKVRCGLCRSHRQETEIQCLIVIVSIVATIRRYLGFLTEEIRGYGFAYINICIYEPEEKVEIRPTIQFAWKLTTLPKASLSYVFKWSRYSLPSLSGWPPTDSLVIGWVYWAIALSEMMNAWDLLLGVFMVFHLECRRCWTSSCDFILWLNSIVC